MSLQIDLKCEYKLMSTPGVYGELAYLWPLLSPVEDYAADAEAICQLISDKLGSLADKQKPSVVEFGAGGGHTLHHLSKEFETAAVDLSDAMLDCSRALNPLTEHHVGDMRTIRLGRLFDVVLVHDAVDYLRTQDDLQAMLQTAKAHLNPGGLVAIAPTYVSETFEPGQTVDDVNADDHVQVRYLSRIGCVQDATRQANVLSDAFELCMTIVIRKQGEDGISTLQIEHDRHTCGLFSTQTWVQLMQEAGFTVEQRDLLADLDGDDEVGVPMFVGHLPT
jgi:SAM-dependent methyltransferase